MTAIAPPAHPTWELARSAVTTTPRGCGMSRCGPNSVGNEAEGACRGRDCEVLAEATAVLALALRMNTTRRMNHGYIDREDDCQDVSVSGAQGHQGPAVDGVQDRRHS